MQQHGDLIAVEHGGGGRQAAATARTGQDIDGEAPGKQCPADTPRSGGRWSIVGCWLRAATVGVEQGSDAAYVRGFNVLARIDEDGVSELLRPRHEGIPENYPESRLVASVAAFGSELYIVFETRIYRRVADAWEVVDLRGIPPVPASHNVPTNRAILPVSATSFATFAWMSHRERVNIFEKDVFKANLDHPDCDWFDGLGANEVAASASGSLYAVCKRSTLWHHRDRWLEVPRQDDDFGYSAVETDSKGRV